MIYITGDTHGNPNRLNEIARRGDAEYILVCGDFGFLWDESHEDENALNMLNRQRVPILFIDGNHENYDLLSRFPIAEWNGAKVSFIRENIIHLKRGQILNLNGYKIFTMGGAECHDISDGIIDPTEPGALAKIRKYKAENKRFRVKGISWWPEELPSKSELQEGLVNLATHNYTVDLILSHCASSSMQTKLGRGHYPINRLTEYLDDIQKNVNYKLWVMGHYHGDSVIDEKHVLLYQGAIQLELSL